MKEISYHDRASALLFEYKHINNDIVFDAPLELTQDGIAMGLGVSRGHSNVIIKRMIDNNEVEVVCSSIKGSNSAKKR